MRVGFQLARIVDPAASALSRLILYMAERLAAAGHEVHIFTTAAYETPSFVHRHVVESFEPDCIAAATRAARLDVVLGRGRTNLGMHVHRPSLGTVAGLWRQKAASFRSPVLRGLWRLVNYLHPRQRALAAYERRQYAQTDPRPRFVAQSEMVARDMREHHGVTPDRIHVIHNAVDIDRFSPALRDPDGRREARRRFGIPPDAVSVLFVGNAFRRKGLRELLEAAAILRRKGRPVRLTVVGALRRNVIPTGLWTWWLGCRGIVHFTDALPDVRPAYAAADLFVLPTWYDPCSNVVLEALACGLPVVTTRFNGASELMQDGREGFVLDTPADVAALADRIERLCDPTLREVIGGSARRLAERHALERAYRDYLRVLEIAAEESRGAS